MKRELKLNFGELRLVEERVTEFEGALTDIDAAAAYFDDVLGEQESEAVKALMERYRKMEKKIRYFQDILGRLKTLLGSYIDDMESHIMPKDEDVLMLVDRNDIWWNMKQIEANISLAGDVASGRELSYYRDIDTKPSPPHIYEGMSPEAENAAWEGYRQNLRESQNREANYNRLRDFCDGTARDARNSLNEFYDRLEELYKKHVVEFENTDDDYKRKAGEVYDACTGIGERFWDNAERKVGFFLDIHKGTAAAAVDFLSGIQRLAVGIYKIEAALMAAVVTMPFGITPKWVKDTGKEALEGARNIVQILKNPGRALAAIGQQATDAVEEKGIPYAVSYAAADITIGILVDKGIGKLKALGKTDDVAKLSTKADDVVDMADDLEAGVKAVEKIDDAADAGKVADRIDDAADAVDKVEDVVIEGIEGGSSSLIDIDAIRPQLKTEPDTAFFWSGRTDGIGGAENAANIAKRRGGVTLESTIETQNIVMPEWDFNNPSTMEAWDLASGAYAEQVSGEIRAVIGSELRPGNIWENVELPRLKNNPNVTKITTIDPKTGIENVIFER